MTSAANIKPRKRAAGAGGAVLIALALLASGCGTASLDSARGQFYAGRFSAADETLVKETGDGLNRVLVLLERGTIRQSAAKYDASAQDFDKAHNEIERMVAISVSQDTGSMVVNDNVQEYRAPPFERTLMHAIDANNYLALGKWDDAAVEARRITRSLEPERRKDYPEDAYSRYVAGLCFELVNDSSSAAFEYRKAAKVSPGPRIGEDGSLAASSNAVPKKAGPGDTAELVCLVAMGHSPPGEAVHNNQRPFDRPGYAEIYSGGRLLGRSYCLADTADLAFTTAQKDAARKAVKTVARIAAKEVIAYQIERNNELLGALVRLALMAMEQPDVRRWETLPRWLSVARVPCPPDLREFDVVFRGVGGVELGRQHITAPLQRNGNLYVSFCRDIAPRP